MKLLPAQRAGLWRLFRTNQRSVWTKRLVRRIHQPCRTNRDVPDELLNKFEITRSQRFDYGQGCSQCRWTGYHGRTGIYELLVNTAEIQQLIASKVPDSQIFAAARNLGMQTMWHNGLQKAKAGITTLDEVLRTAPPALKEKRQQFSASPQDTGGDRAVTQQSTAQGATNSGLKGDRILIIDDDPAILKIVEKYLRDEYYETVTALDGTEGMNQVFAKAPDLIILDYTMPNMDGPG